MIHIVANYDNMALMLLLMLAFQFQNSSTIGFTKLLMIDDEESIFGVLTLNDITLQGLLKYEHIYFAICMRSLKIF
jgi:hypothetical protein